jgi:hypothetical protein
LGKIQSVVAEIFNFLYFEVVFHWRLYQEFLILIWSPELIFKILG